MIEIIELKAHEAELCKTLRLRALKDSPFAFSQTWEETIGLDDEYWSLITQSMVEPNKQRMFIARDEHEYIASLYALLDANDKAAGRIGGMWVDSCKRGKGVGRKLFLSVKSWAESLALKRIKLWVEDTDDSARLFYARLGFLETGIKDYSKKKLCEMQYDL